MGSTVGDMSKAYTTAEGFGKVSMPNNKEAIKEVKPSQIDKENEIAFPLEKASEQIKVPTACIKVETNE